MPVFQWEWGRAVDVPHTKGPHRPGCLQTKGHKASSLESHWEKCGGPVTFFLGDFWENAMAIQMLNTWSSLWLKLFNFPELPACYGSAVLWASVACVTLVPPVENPVAGTKQDFKEDDSLFCLVHLLSQALGSHQAASFTERRRESLHFTMDKEGSFVEFCMAWGLNTPLMKRLNRWTLRIGIRSRKKKPTTFKKISGRGVVSLATVDAECRKLSLNALDLRQGEFSW